jgi:cob(I)alamin adenosyltransferase
VRTPEQADIDAAQQGLNEIREDMRSGRFDVVILDEANIALHFGLFTVDELLNAVSCRHHACEVVITGRNAPQELIDAADLVTEMREIKHYYREGVEARTGIER